ncbi:ABC transporter substrate-binding protein [Rhizomonospora bruguierae]|uniref:ABC transporter substrate-binding protein n=1 Tax=Rhizomonospora bruguierae TaxID=1581705 RepID=UPI001BCCF192|nr:ABC transporter substrate-binding protein [Micromonospora sp. NBRC 107566]
MTSAACSSDPETTGADGTMRINYTHSSAPSPSFALFECVADRAGFWKDEGLAVTVNTIDGGTAAMQSLVSGQSDITDTGTSSLLPAVAAGGELVAFHSLVTGAFVYPAVLASSPITEMPDLEGKRVGALSLASGGIPFLKSVMAASGGDPEKLKFIAVGDGAPAVAALQNGQVDALIFGDTNYALMEKLDVELRYLINDVVRKSGFGVAYSARRDWLTANRDAAGRFARAASKAYVFAKANPELAMRMCWDIYPELLPAGKDEADALESQVTALVARLASSGPVEGKIGFATDEQVQSVIDQQVMADVIKGGSVTVADVWTAEVNTVANDFDQQEVEKLAASFCDDHPDSSSCAG